VANTKENTTIWAIYPRETAKKANAFFQEIALQEPSFSLSHHVPEKMIQVLEEAKKELSKDIAGLQKEIAKYARYRDDYKAAL
jgi:hypothetical protein